MKTLHTAYRIRELDRSLDFYARFGFREIGRVSRDDDAILVMLNLPGDGDLVTLELVYEPRLLALDVGNGLSHLVVQVENLDLTLAGFAERGISFEKTQYPGGEAGPKTCFLNDPDGYRFELVEWPAAHADGITRADFNSLDAGGSFDGVSEPSVD